MYLPTVSVDGSISYRYPESFDTGRMHAKMYPEDRKILIDTEVGSIWYLWGFFILGDTDKGQSNNEKVDLGIL